MDLFKKPPLISQVLLSFLFGILLGPLTNSLKWVIIWYIFYGIYYFKIRNDFWEYLLIFSIALLGWYIGRILGDMNCSI